MFVDNKSKFLGCNLEKYFLDRNRRYANFLLKHFAPSEFISQDFVINGHQHANKVCGKAAPLRMIRRKNHLLNAKSEEKEIPLQLPREFSSGKL